MNLSILKNTKAIYSLIVLLGVLLFVPFNGATHLFDWDEINFAESAREMIVTSDYLTVQIDYKPFWEKPPLFLWMQVVSMKMFGINEFAARFPNAICGIITLLVLFLTGKTIKNERFGFLWALAYAGSVLPFFYFKSGIIDPWFNLFIFLSVFYMARYTQKSFKGNATLQAILSAAFVGLGILTKGPVALLILFLTGSVFLISARFKIRFKIVDLVLFLITLALVGGLWFILQIFNGNFHVIQDFIEYQIRLFKTEDAGHGGFLLYHFVILLIGVFPASIFLLNSFKVNRTDDENDLWYKRWMVYLFWTVLILFTIVNTKIVHYSSMCYFPMAYLAAYYVDKVIERRDRFNKITVVLVGFFATLFGLLVIIASQIDNIKSLIVDKIADPFAVGNLEASGGWGGYEFITGIFLLAGFIWFRKENRQSKPLKASVIMFCSVILFTFFTMSLIVPKVERYSQNAAIEFYKSKVGEDVYVNTIGFKSYAHLFYFQKPNQGKKSTNYEYLMEGDLDKDAYFVLKNFRKKDILKANPELELIFEKNGFVFVKRSKDND